MVCEFRAHNIYPTYYVTNLLKSQMVKSCLFLADIFKLCGILNRVFSYLLFNFQPFLLILYVPHKTNLIIHL